VSRVDLDARKIDFRLVRDTPIKPSTSRPALADKASGESSGARVRSLPPVDGGLGGAPAGAGGRRKKAAPAQTAAVKEARAARGAAKKHGGAAAKSASKPQARKKR
jgi:ribonuclease R